MKIRKFELKDEQWRNNIFSREERKEAHNFHIILIAESLNQKQP